MNDYILTLSCPDRVGIVHRVTGWLLEHDGNIVDAQQYGDTEEKRFFLRVNFKLPRPSSVDALKQSFAPLANALAMDPQISDAQQKARVLILLHRQGHRLTALLLTTHSYHPPIHIIA